MEAVETIENPLPGDFARFTGNVGRIEIKDRTVLIPDMAPFAARLVAASLRAFGVKAQVMDTYTGLQLGKEFCSGKECFPCQVTLGDILYHLHQERKRLGPAFSAGNYVYFLPTADGPCRFGMYNKYQRLILDSFPEYRDITISCISTEDDYSASGILSERDVNRFRKLGYVVLVIADILDRMTWRVRPYENHPGETDAFVRETLAAMIDAIEMHGSALRLKPLYAILEEAARTLTAFIDKSQPRRPRIGIVGEIYVRSHTRSNQDIVRQIERYGGEAVVSSVVEWINFIFVYHAHTRRRKMMNDCLRRQYRTAVTHCIGWVQQTIENGFLNSVQTRIYRRVRTHLDIQPDHSIRRIEQQLDDDKLFSFRLYTETAVSIGASLEYIHDGFDGIVNVFPFTCLPGLTGSAIMNPLFNQLQIPYLDLACDGTAQPDRETAIRTFLYQAMQHLDRKQAENHIHHHADTVCGFKKVLQRIAGIV
jgi:predicted nucleotide-binding protein (sugar kinase/HSP70/actin superfamily)